MSKAEESLSNICLTIVADSADQCAEKHEKAITWWAENQGSQPHRSPPVYGSLEIAALRVLAKACRKEIK